ncbi:MAG: sodium/proton-translocating pyrophosphatase, partial [Bacteroidia bacterium]
VRHRTDNLDAVGNTTAATGKGFAIASAALTSLALFAAFVGVAGIDAIDIYKADVLAGLFVGGMIPFIFSSLAIAAVGRAAMDMVNEVRRQFREIPGIMEYKAKPEYEKCVEISTKASIREMIAPGAIALIVPIIVGFAFGPEVLGGVLAGVTVSGVLMGMFQSNAGGAWDNAKKSFEKGVEINGQIYYKKSEPHKASVTGDTVGDPFKDTSGPSMNILIKLMSIVSLVIAPHISMKGEHATHGNTNTHEKHVIAPAKLVDATYSINAEEAKLEWVGKKVGGQHNGTVNFISGNLLVENGVLSAGEFLIDMQSIECADIPKDDENYVKFISHLKNQDFFNVDSFPQAKLLITRVETIEGNSYKVTANLTIKNITNEVNFVARVFQMGDDAIMAESSFSVDRTKYGIKFKSKTFFSEFADNFIHDDIYFNIRFIAKQ